jgi:polyhydroxybutyrate depolymerase
VRLGAAIAIVVLCLVPLSRARAADQLTSAQLSVDGQTRTYLLYVPATYNSPGSIHALAVVFHGLYNTDQTMLRFVTPQASARGMIVAFPQGVDNSWNAVSCCSAARINKVDDLGFARKLVATLVAQFHPRSVVAAGFSNGAMLSWLIGCQANAFVNAVVDAAGTEGVPESQCTPAHPLTIVAVHGLHDPTVPYNGGASIITQEADYAAPFRPINDVITEWRHDHDRCASSSNVAASGWSTTQWTGCASRTSVVLYTIGGMGHDVPSYGSGDPVDFGTLVVNVASRS